MEQTQILHSRLYLLKVDFLQQTDGLMQHFLLVAVNDILEKVAACGTNAKAMRMCMEDLVASGRIAAIVGVDPPQATEAVPSPRGWKHSENCPERDLVDSAG